MVTQDFIDPAISEHVHEFASRADEHTCEILRGFYILYRCICVYELYQSVAGDCIAGGCIVVVISLCIRITYGCTFM